MRRARGRKKAGHDLHPKRVGPRQDGAPNRHPLCDGHDPAPPPGRPRRPCFSHRRLVVCLPRLLSVDPPGPEIQLPDRSPPDRRGAAVRDQGAAVHPRRGRRPQADPSRHDLRQDGELVPARPLPGLQGAPEGSARRAGAAVPADARHRLGVRHGPDRAGPLRGRRHHRHLRPSGARGRRRCPHRLGRQGPHAARRPVRLDVRSGFGPGRGRRLSRGAALRPGRGGRIFWRRRGQGDRRPGACRRFDRQRSGRARHRAQDRSAAHHRIWRPRDAARAGGRDQAAEASRSADRPRERQAHQDLERARDSGSKRAGRDAARGAGDASARRQAARRVLQGDGADDPHPPRRRDLRRRRGLDRPGPALRRPRGLAGRPGRGAFAARRRGAGAARALRFAGPCSRAARAQGRPAGDCARGSRRRARHASARPDRPRRLQDRADRGRA